MPYYLDLSTISLSSLQQHLKTTPFLLPSQMILREEIDARFAVLTSHGILDMAALKEALKTKTRVEKFAGLSGLPLDFLTVLRREVNSWHPAARKITDFPHISEQVKSALLAEGVKTSRDLYERAAARSDREELREQLGISSEMMMLLVKSADVSRLRYVNPPFAALLVHTRYDTVEKIKSADPQALLDELLRVNAEHDFYKARMGLKDMRFLVADPAYSPSDIEY